MLIEEKLKAAIRNVPDFPRQGILFRDITPVLKDAGLCKEVVEAFARRLENIRIDAVAGIESRGFLFGVMLAARLNLPFIPIRKQGRLPFHTYTASYDLEYGTSVLEIHTDALSPGSRVLLHDDLLATGGTAMAAKKLVEGLGATVAAYAFLTDLHSLFGYGLLNGHSEPLVSLASY